LPRCRIVLDRAAKSPGFPFVSRYKDVGGEVVYALDVGANGAFSNPRLLAASPHYGFAQSVEDVLPSWRWKIEGGAQPPSCRMPSVHILTFEFTLGR
jgi:outer membrane biosynthesis protein TonB